MKKIEDNKKLPSATVKPTDIDLASGRTEHILDGYIDVDASELKDPYEVAEASRGRRKKHTVLLCTFMTLVLLLGVACVLIFTQAGRRFIYDKVGDYVDGKLDTTDDSGVTFDDIQHDDPSALIKEDYVFNLLLCGVEAIGGGNGRSDSMTIISVNTKSKSIKTTTLQRDILVDIPGWKEQKLNAAFSHGGPQLAALTIEKYFGIMLDAYVYVTFESFEQVIDLVGGVEIELGEKEVKYLNRTNYISKKENRNLHAGVMLLNGNQALGYCRVRKVATLGGLNDDLGRSMRQRRVMNALFDAYKGKNIFTLISLANKLMPLVKTNMTGDMISRLIGDVVEHKIMSLESIEIPAKGTYKENSKYPNVGWVLLPDFEKNRQIMKDFIYQETP